MGDALFLKGEKTEPEIIQLLRLANADGSKHFIYFAEKTLAREWFF
jgi:hypothetical protein